MKLKDILKLIGLILVPLTIGVATTISTVQQIKLNQQNRQNDIEIGKQEREQGSKIADNSEKERILASYLTYISNLFLEKNITAFDIDSITSTIVRAKTLSTIRQLDIERKHQVILFLYETQLIRIADTVYPIINLNNVELDNLDLSLPKSNEKLYPQYEIMQLAFRGVSLRNSSFSSRWLHESDFSHTDLTKGDFTLTHSIRVDFSYSLLEQLNFMNATVDQAIFAYANLTDSNISEEQLSTTLTYGGAILPNGTIAPLKNLLMNGNARCSNLSIFPDGWTVSDGNISIIQERFSSNCYFGSFRRESIMNQKIDLSDYSQWIRNQQDAHYIFNISIFKQNNIIINIKQFSANGTQLRIVTFCQNPLYCNGIFWTCQSSSNCYDDDYIDPLHKDTQSVDIEIIFQTINENSNLPAICDNISFYMILMPKRLPVP
ncbi:unnamed protein product [Didymodactylos carnosus]|uniref:Uncharacterized protein n=1 Tax=Didymodactylos carnosus TaxID=1234261 RepID=A0A815GQU7_9BILA|nr:unnamed protein product [Didymodactylos carnosus]CAF1342174.1 unnamed protein product [Didymodactylos carnosus]CAF4115841.1 unnamed protein product [Didymodactylos carnosus]CAF4204238.1 unnamed protein product [Didymodactylos carnosus]